MSWTLVTGGAKRLGAQICKTLAKEGHDVVVHYNTSEREATEVAHICSGYGVKAEIIRGDFSTTEGAEKFAEEFLTRFSSANTLINNVGNFIQKPLLDTSASEWEKLYQVNFHAPVLLIHKFLPGIKAAQGNIINIGVSGLGTMHSNISNTAYGLSKLNLWMATKALARELAPANVRVNMVSPGRLENSIDRAADLSAMPMQRLGTTQEVARTVAFLLDKESAYITGQNIEVAGGLGL